MYPDRDTLSNVPRSGYNTTGDRSMLEVDLTEGGKKHCQVLPLAASFLFRE